MGRLGRDHTFSPLLGKILLRSQKRHVVLNELYVPKIQTSESRILRRSLNESKLKSFSLDVL